MSLKVILYAIYLDFLAFFRIKIAVFFSIVFPVLIFILFSTIWGSSSSYIEFLLTGVISMMIISEGLFSIGPVVKDYFSSGMIKYLKFYPTDISFPFITFIISRLIFFQIIILLLSLISYFFYDYNIFINYDKVLLASFIGFVIFSFFGLSISFFHKKKSSYAFSNLIYFALIFTNDLFYPISDNVTLKKVNYYLPVEHLSNILRNKEFNIYILSLWLIVLFIIFRILFNRIRVNR
jgi:ABC-2 type transport system permease protein